MDNSRLIIEIFGGILALFSTGGFFYMIYEKRAEKSKLKLENDLDNDAARDKRLVEQAQLISELKVDIAKMEESSKWKDKLIEQLLESREDKDEMLKIWKNND